MRLIIVRHGETEENIKRMLVGHMHGHLSTKGKRQAKEVGLILQDCDIDRIYSSDLKRAVDTTNAIAKHHKKVPITYSRALREQNYGIFQGKSLHEMLTDPDYLRLRGNFRPTGGESLNQLRARVHKFIKDLAKLYPNDVILISAHAGIAYSIFSLCSGVPMWDAVKLKARNTGVIVVEMKRNKLKILKDDMFE